MLPLLLLIFRWQDQQGLGLIFASQAASFSKVWVEDGWALELMVLSEEVMKELELPLS
ncbi:MAG: hypothetical protein ABJH04_15245 [Cyclobacteriaceae bacterium]